MTAPSAGVRTRAGYEQAVAELATRVVTAVRSGGDPGLLADFVDTALDRVCALAAVRVLGSDSVMASPMVDQASRELVVEAVDTFSLPTVDAVSAWQQWALLRAVEYPSPLPGSLPYGVGEHWRAFASAMVALSALASPGFDSPLHEAARGRSDDLARAATRATIRRDHPTAAALARWLTFTRASGVRIALDPGLLVTHLGIVAGPDPRIALDLNVAGQLMTGARR